MLITKELLQQGVSKNGSWSYKQLKLLGLKHPLKSGWKQKILGLEITLEAAAEFVGLQNKHLTEDGKAKSNSKFAKQANEKREKQGTINRLNEEIQALTEEIQTLRALNSLR